MSSDSDYNNENENDSDASVDDPVPIVNYDPWFTVVDPNTFTISRLQTASCGPIDFDPYLRRRLFYFGCHYGGNKSVC